MIRNAISKYLGYAVLYARFWLNYALVRMDEWRNSRRSR